MGRRSLGDGSGGSDATGSGPKTWPGRATAWRRGLWPGLKLPEIVLLCSLAFTAVVTWGLLQASERADRARFGVAVAQSHQAIRERINTHIAVLRATAGLFETHAADQDSFVRFASRLRLQQDYPGIQGLGWSLRLAPGQSGAAGTQIWPTREPEPHGIAYLYPLDRRNRAALGFNMYSEATRRTAMSQARDTALPWASGPVELVQEIDQAKQKGFLIYVPVYSGQDAPRTVEDRRRRLVGFAYGAFRTGDLFASIFGPEDAARRLRITVHDGAPGPANLLHRSWSGPDRQAEFSREESVSVAGRTWRVRYQSGPEFETGSGRAVAWLIMALGVLTSLTLYLSARALMRGRLAAEAAAKRAEREVQVRLRAEEHQQLLINELNHRVKNTLATVQSIGAQTLRSAPDMTEARERYEARLMALSAAHNVLTSHHWEGAGIGEVVTSATAPFETGPASSFRREGPEVTLPPPQALALAMALHELGTNAVKYGALSRPGGRVAVSWSVSGAGDVHLVWREEGGPPVAKPARSGFGMRLIERSLARDLGGEVKLHFPHEGVRCDIRFRVGEARREAAE